MKREILLDFCGNWKKRVSKTIILKTERRNERWKKTTAEMKWMTFNLGLVWSGKPINPKKNIFVSPKTSGNLVYVAACSTRWSTESNQCNEYCVFVSTEWENKCSPNKSHWDAVKVKMSEHFKVGAMKGKHEREKKILLPAHNRIALTNAKSNWARNTKREQVKAERTAKKQK